METTFKDRLNAEDLTADLISNAELAQRMITRLYYTHFADNDAGLNAYQAAEVADTLDAIIILLSHAIKDAALDLGEGEPEQYAQINRRATIRRVAELNSAAIDIESKATGKELERLLSLRTAALKQPDAQAIKELEQLIASRKQ